MRRRQDDVLFVEILVRMILQLKAVTGTQRAAVRDAGVGSDLRIEGGDAVFDRSLVVLKDVRQIARLLAAAFVNAVVFSGIAAGKIVNLQLLIAAGVEDARLFGFEFFVRKLKMIIPKSLLAASQFVIGTPLPDCRLEQHAGI